MAENQPSLKTSPHALDYHTPTRSAPLMFGFILLVASLLALLGVFADILVSLIAHNSDHVSLLAAITSAIAGIVVISWAIFRRLRTPSFIAAAAGGLILLGLALAIASHFAT